MKIAATKDFKRTQEKVFAAFADPARMEAVLGGFGSNLERDGPAEGGIGTLWRVDVTSRGKSRPVALTLNEMVRNESMALRATSEMFDADIRFVFSDLPGGGSQVAADIEVTAKTLASRVALQTARLARTKINNKIVRALTVLGKPADKAA